MADPKRGATAPPKSGAYRTPVTDGVRETNESNPYRPPRDGIKDIGDINYIPYGGVYEWDAVHPVDRVATGGAFEPYTEVVPDEVAYFIMSSPYPPLVVDSMAIDSLIIAGEMRSLTLDSMSVGAEITAGALSTLLKTYTVPHEDVSIDAPITAGTLVVSLKTYSVPHEDVSIDALITAGTLVAVLITYSNWTPESLDVDSLITGGTLA